MGVVDSLRQPKHIGENRCMPCTVVNVGIAVALALSVWPVAGGSVAGAVFFTAIGVIYLRGYLVPKTPELTKRYLPASVLRLFGKEPVRVRTLGTIDGDRTVEESLVTAGVLVNEEPLLTDSFADAWANRIDEIRTEEIDEAVLESLLGTVEVSRHAETGAVVEGNQSVRWLSKPAMVADVAAGRVLDDRVDGWESVSPDERIRLLRGLRLFMPSCPSCGGTTRVDVRTVDPCCDPPHTLVNVVCSACETPLADEAVVGIDEESSARLRAIRN